MSPDKYDLSHLVQPPNQDIGGPIQDDEALLLYAVVRTMRVKRVLEIGGLDGYSAKNFLKAVSWDEPVAVYTVDLNEVPRQSPRHHVIQKDVGELEPSDVDGLPLDLVFFDAHVLEEQMAMFVKFTEAKIITDLTVIALHDTNLHYRKTASWSYPIIDTDGQSGYVHQPVERTMVNTLRSQYGYDAFCAHMQLVRSDLRLPFRHGLTLMRKFKELRT